jgi:hypothetical protein
VENKQPIRREPDKPVDFETNSSLHGSFKASCFPVRQVIDSAVILAYKNPRGRKPSTVFDWENIDRTPTVTLPLH